MQARIRRACVHTAWESYFHDKALIGLSACYKDVSSYIGWRQEPRTLDGTTYAVSVPLDGRGDPFPALKFLSGNPFFFWPALENCGVHFIRTIHHGGTSLWHQLGDKLSTESGTSVSSLPLSP